MDIESWAIFFSLIITAMLLGYYILTYKIINDYDINNIFAVMIFCLVFSFSVNCMAIILFEIWKIGTEFSRLTMWRIVLSFLVYSTLFIIPSIMIYKIIERLKIS